MDSPELVKFSPISLEGFHVTTVLLVLAAHTLEANVPAPSYPSARQG